MNESVIVLAGGDVTLWPDVSIFDSADYMIGVDRGAYE